MLNGTQRRRRRATRRDWRGGAEVGKTQTVGNVRATFLKVSAQDRIRCDCNAEAAGPWNGKQRQFEARDRGWNVRTKTFPVEYRLETVCDQRSSSTPFASGLNLKLPISVAV